MRIETVFILGLLFTLYFGIFSFQSSQVSTVNGVGSKYCQGWPAYFLIEFDERVNLENRTLWLRSTTFYPLTFLIDWLIFTTAILIAVNVYNYGKKKFRPSTADIYKKYREASLLTSIDIDVAKLTAKKRWARLAVVISILFSIVYIATMNVFLFCLGVAFLILAPFVGRQVVLIEHKIDDLKISQLKSERGAPFESD